MESRALTLAVTFGLGLVLTFWLVVVAVLLVDFTPGTNEISISTETAPAAAADVDLGAADQAENADEPGTEAADEGAPSGTAAGDATEESVETADDPDQTGDTTADAPSEVALASIAHRIAPGDTLIAIGAQYGVDWQQIASINNIADPNLIAAGRILQIPDPDAVSLVTISTVEEDAAAELDGIFDAWAAQTEVPVELLKAVAWQESRWDPGAVGLQGEVGIGQLLPEIHRFVETDLSARPLDATDPADSVEAMARYLGWLLGETQGDTSATLASYHQGLVSQRNIGWDDSTIQYIASVVAIRPEFVDRPAS